MSSRLAIVLLVSFSSLPAHAQTSLDRQREICDSLREEVDSARNELDQAEALQASREQSAAQISSYARAGGKSEAQIAAGESFRRSLEGNATLAPARRYRAATERYNLQACASGGSATYNYDVTSTPSVPSTPPRSQPAAATKVTIIE